MNNLTKIASLPQGGGCKAAPVGEVQSVKRKSGQEAFGHGVHALGNEFHVVIAQEKQRPSLKRIWEDGILVWADGEPLPAHLKEWATGAALEWSALTFEVNPDLVSGSAA